MWYDRFLLALVIFFLPSQLAYHFLEYSTSVYGLQIDYLIPTFYFTEILLILLLVVWSVRLNKARLLFSVVSRFWRHYLFFLFLILLIVNIIAVSPNKVISVSMLVRFILLSGLVSYIAYEKISRIFIVRLLLASSLWVMVVVFGQVYLQKSIGGMWYFLGERQFSISTWGVAKSEIFNTVKLRPYGTFPHPNVLAGYLTLMISLSFLLIKRIKLGISYGYFLAMNILVVLTLSRVALLVSVGGYFILLRGLVAYKLIRQKHSRIFSFSLFAIFAASIYLFKDRLLEIGIINSESFVKRAELLTAGLTIFKNNFVLGSGLGTFVQVLPVYSRDLLDYGYLQPVHNVFILAASELGLMGLVSLLCFTVWLYLVINKYQSFQTLVLKVLFWQILVLSSFDHYFYTLWQGQLLLGVLIGLMLRGDEK